MFLFYCSRKSFGTQGGISVFQKPILRMIPMEGEGEVKKILPIILLVITTITTTGNKADSRAPDPPGEKVLYGRVYERVGETVSGAGIYSNPENNRAKHYVLAAIEDAGLHDGMSDFEKACAVNAYLVDELSYADYATVEGYPYKEDYVPFTDYCLLSDHAVCAGYAEAFQSRCCALGIECWYVTGYVSKRGEICYHAWNCVVIGGMRYYMDPCLNDGSDNAFCMSETLWATHAVEKEHEIFRISGQRLPFPDLVQERHLSGCVVY